MKNERHSRKLFKLLITTIALFLIGYGFFYSKIAIDDEAIRQCYETIKEKQEFLKTISSDVVKEYEGIEFKQFSETEIKYNVYADGENITVCYYIDEKNGDEYPYKATITLSNEYQILDEQYPEIEHFEKKKKSIKFFEKLLSFIYASVATALVVFLVFYVPEKIFLPIKEAYNNAKQKKSC